MKTGQTALIKAKRKCSQRSNGGREGTRPDPRTWSRVRLFMTRNGRSDQIQYLHLTLRPGLGMGIGMGMGMGMGLPAVTIYDVQPGRRTGTTSPASSPLLRLLVVLLPSNGCCSSCCNWPMAGELMKIINTERPPTVTSEQRICILIKYPKSHINHIRAVHRVSQVEFIGRLPLNGFTNFSWSPPWSRSLLYMAIPVISFGPHFSFLIFRGGHKYCRKRFLNEYIFNF